MSEVAQIVRRHVKLFPISNRSEGNVQLEEREVAGGDARREDQSQLGRNDAQFGS